jgi:hypothetical protein
MIVKRYLVSDLYNLGANNFSGRWAMVGVGGRSGGNRKYDGAEMTPDDGGPIKPDLPQAVGQKWDELVRQMPTGSLREIDGHELRILAELLVMTESLAEVVRSEPANHRAARVYLNTVVQVHRLSASFGLNPGDRKRLAIAPRVDEQDGLAMMLKRRSANR